MKSDDYSSNGSPSPVIPAPLLSQPDQSLRNDNLDSLGDNNTVTKSDDIIIQFLNWQLNYRKMEMEMEIKTSTLDLDRKDRELDIKRREIELSAVDQQLNEHWLKAYWRPVMAILYAAICAMDFIIAPILQMLIPTWTKLVGYAMVPDHYTQWQSITLQNGGSLHIAFAAILGVAAWTRGQEIAARNANTPPYTQPYNPPYR